MNKKLTTIATMAILGLIILLFSCNKRNLESVIINQPNTEISTSIGDRIIDLKSAQIIGQNHNNFLKLGIQNSPQNLTELKANFDAITVDGLSQEQKNDIYNYFQNNSIKDQEGYIISQISSKDGKQLFYETKNIIIDGSNFNDKSVSFDNLENKVSQLTIEKDKEILLTYIETSRSSLKFWMAYANNGQYKSSSNQKLLLKATVNWGAIGAADGAGAAGVLLRTWYLADFGPLSWGAILGAIGWGAAWSSGASLLYQIM